MKPKNETGGFLVLSRDLCVARFPLSSFQPGKSLSKWLQFCTFLSASNS